MKPKKTQMKSRDEMAWAYGNKWPSGNTISAFCAGWDAATEAHRGLVEALEEIAKPVPEWSDPREALEDCEEIARAALHAPAKPFSGHGKCSRPATR